MGDIIVRVLDKQGTPVPGAVVSARNTDAWFETVYTGTTDRYGMIKFEGVKAGTMGDHYEITASAAIDGDTMTGRVHKQIGALGIKNIQTDIVLSTHGATVLGTHPL